MVEGHALAGKFVDVRRIDILASVTTQVKPAQVIREDEQDIGFSGLGRSVNHNATEGTYNQA
jgi:hypothetical protein